MQSILAEKRIRDDLVFPEDPRWRDARLYFSDIFDGRVWTIDENGAGAPIAEMEDCPSGLGFLPDGDLLVVSMHRARLLRWRGGTSQVHADLAHLAPGLNDMAVDLSGRAYVVQYAPHKPDAVPLVIVEPDGSARLGDETLQFGNGIRLTEDGRRLIVAESAGCQLSLFDVDADGGLSGRRILPLPDDHHPDGICLDEAGGIWISCLSHGVIRLTLEGVVTHCVTLPAALNAYACMLGGADRRTLFVCAAQSHLPDVARRTRSGAIFAVETEHRGSGLD
ncbi:MAG: SMP-30/gluconolactonase/LRE family protein [Bradyrhizobium sp.]|nr:SMP-30/gluconolactonase/LRE family protein [Bradyrhizobium sp.]